MAPIVRKLVGHGRLEGTERYRSFWLTCTKWHAYTSISSSPHSSSSRKRGKAANWSRSITRRQLLTNSYLPMREWHAGPKAQLRKQFALVGPAGAFESASTGPRRNSLASTRTFCRTDPPAVLELYHFVRSLGTAWRNGEVRAHIRNAALHAKPHTWRTRPDPYEEVWPLLQQRLNEEPHTTAKGLFRRLNTEMPNRFKAGSVSNSSTAGCRLANRDC